MTLQFLDRLRGDVHVTFGLTLVRAVILIPISDVRTKKRWSTLSDLPASPVPKTQVFQSLVAY